MKKIYSLLICILLILSHVFAQDSISSDKYSKFERSFLSAIKYSDQLLDRCIPTLTTMKLKFNEQGELDSLSFSDSAFPQFVDEVIAKKNQIDFRSLFEELRSLGKQDLWILVPIQFDTKIGGRCESAIRPYDLEHSTIFLGKPLTGKYYLHKKIYGKVGIGIMYTSIGRQMEAANTTCKIEVANLVGRSS